MKSTIIAALLFLPSLALADSFTLSPDVPLCSNITLSSTLVLRDFDMIESEDENFYFHPTTMTCLEIGSRPYRVREVWTEEPKEEEVAWRVSVASFTLVALKDGSIKWEDAPVNLITNHKFNGATLIGPGDFVSQLVHLSSGVAYNFMAWLTIIDSGTSSWGTVNLTLSKYPDIGSADFGFASVGVGIVGDQRLEIRYVPDMDRDIYVGIKNFGFNGISRINDVSGFALP